MLTPLVIIRDRDYRTSIAKLLFCCGKKTGDLEVKNNERRSSVLKPFFNNSMQKIQCC